MSQTHEYQSDLFRRLVAEGREEGREEGRVEGRVEGKVGAIFEVLAARGIEVAPAVAAQIRGCGDAAVLDRWLARAVVVSSAHELPA